MLLYVSSRTHLLTIRYMGMFLELSLVVWFGVDRVFLKKDGRNSRGRPHFRVGTPHISEPLFFVVGLNRMFTGG